MILRTKNQGITSSWQLWLFITLFMSCLKIELGLMVQISSQSV